MYAPAVQISWSRVTPWLAAAIRPRPRLVASARMAASSAFPFSPRSPGRRVGKGGPERGEQRVPVLAPLAGAQVGEGRREAGRPADLVQYLGDAREGQHRVEP